MSDATYRKLNDGSLNSSTYHKKDGTNVRAKLKHEDQAYIDENYIGGHDPRYDISEDLWTELYND